MAFRGAVIDLVNLVLLVLALLGPLLLIPRGLQFLGLQGPLTRAIGWIVMVIALAGVLVMDLIELLRRPAILSSLLAALVVISIVWDLVMSRRVRRKAEEP